MNASPAQRRVTESVSADLEFHSYLSDKSTDLGHARLWWKSNAVKYTHLAVLALRCLAIQPTSVASERVFSLSGRVISKTNKNSSGDEIANVNFLRQHRTCRGQRLRPFNEFVISTKRLRQKRYTGTLPTCLEMDSPVQSASHNKWTRPSVKETHQATWV